MPKKSSKVVPSVSEAAPLKAETPATKEKKVRAKHVAPRSRKAATVAAPVPVETVVRAESAPVEKPVATPVVKPTYEELQQEIANLAYFFWQERGQAHGYSVEDWLRAEHEVLSRVK